MNECEQIHPLLRGYVAGSLSARDRRLVARHLNLCAMARRELDRIRSGPLKAPETSVNPPSEPWDLKILRWLFKTPKPSPRKEIDEAPKKSRSGKGPERNSGRASSGSSWKPVFFIVLFFATLVLLTHFIQNAGENPAVKGVKRWMSQNGIHVFGVQASLELVLDLTNLPHWEGNGAPVAVSHQELITDPTRLRIYWQFLQPGVTLPEVDFTKNALAFVFLGPKATSGYAIKFKRAENYSDRTVLWYDEVIPNAATAAPVLTRPWVIQMVPKPSQMPVVIEKIQ